MVKPASGKTYKLSQVLDLSLGDSPCLQIRDVGVVQDSHLNVEELLSIDGIADTNWTYLRTTNELIPVFQYSFDNPSYLEFFDTEPYKNPVYPEDDLQWVTPKGFPRKQED